MSGERNKMSENHDDDWQLINAYLNGNQAAFNTLYERYRRPLYSYLNKMMPGQTALVDDIFQATWMKAIDSLDKYQDKQKFFAWLVCIGRNKAIDHFRKEKKRQTVDIDDVQLSEERSIPWQKIGNEELGEAISEAVAQLSEEQQEVFILRQQDVAFKDIAEIQGCSLNTVLGRMHYALNNLRKILREWR